MLSILLVDDDPIQLRVREAILRRFGMSVHVATTGDSALALLRSIGGQIGAVVCDHVLPGRNGVEVVRELRQILPGMPVLVLSGMPDIEEEYVGLDVEVRLKPFPPEELGSLVRQMMNSNNNTSTEDLAS